MSRVTGRDSAARSVRNAVVFWGLMRLKHPFRVSSKEFQDVFEKDGYDVCLRTVQLFLVAHEDNGLIYSDEERIGGWRLTQKGCEFLGLAPKENTPMGASLYE